MSSAITKVEIGDSWTLDGAKITVKGIRLERWTYGEQFTTTLIMEREQNDRVEQIRTSVSELATWLDGLRPEPSE